ncbi:MAG TPA: ferrous iron transport protein A [Candidatus Merdivicinus intestinavium]|nr:ferrous iron transport protein A [Candidatus Merdivicinus intestinavium]
MNERIQPLNRMGPGQSARVVRLEVAGELRRRLLDLGLIEGTRVRCLHRAPCGDPAAYDIRGAVIALRDRDSAGILAAPLPR